MKPLTNFRIVLLSPILVLVVMLVSESAHANFAFGEPVNLGSGVNSPLNDAGAWVMPDEPSLYFWRGAR